MVAKVVDASVASAILFDEPAAETAFDRLYDAELFAPYFLILELANVCWKKCRQRPVECERLIDAFAERQSLMLQFCEIDEDASVLLALENGLSAYDASYLWLSRRLGAELITFDRRLAAAAADDRA